MALEHTTWRLIRMIGNDGQTLDLEALAPDEQNTITATFEPSDAGALRISGRGGCNRYTGACSISGDTLTFGTVASTRMMCPPEVMEREARYYQLLGATQRYEQHDNALTIFCQPGELHFTRTEE